MGSTVAPKMFSQPGVFGTSDTAAVVNKTNPAQGLAGSPVAPPPPSSGPTATPAPSADPVTGVKPWALAGYQSQTDWLKVKNPDFNHAVRMGRLNLN